MCIVKLKDTIIFCPLNSIFVVSSKGLKNDLYEIEKKKARFPGVEVKNRATVHKAITDVAKAVRV